MKKDKILLTATIEVNFLIIRLGYKTIQIQKYKATFNAILKSTE